MNVEVLLEDVIAGNDLILLVEPLPLCVSLVQENLLLNVLTLLDLLHVKSAQVFLHKVRRYETNEWQNYPKQKPVHVVDMFGCIICEPCHKLSIYESKQFVYHVHHTLTLDLTYRVNNLGLQLIAHHSYRRYRDSSEDSD